MNIYLNNIYVDYIDVQYLRKVKKKKLYSVITIVNIILKLITSYNTH